MESLTQRSLPRVRAVFAAIVIVLVAIGLQLVRLQVLKAAAVSYTHLTLPTSDLV